MSYLINKTQGHIFSSVSRLDVLLANQVEKFELVVERPCEYHCYLELAADTEALREIIAQVHIAHYKSHVT
jgi:hypothetical protein